jgi:hypothetical protein
MPSLSMKVQHNRPSGKHSTKGKKSVKTIAKTEPRKISKKKKMSKRRKEIKILRETHYPIISTSPFKKYMAQLAAEFNNHKGVRFAKGTVETALGIVENRVIETIQKWALLRAMNPKGKILQKRHALAGWHMTVDYKRDRQDGPVGWMFNHEETPSSARS